MFASFRKALSEETIDGIVATVGQQTEAGDHAAAWTTLQPLLRAQKHQAAAALAVCSLVEEQRLGLEHAADALHKVLLANSEAPDILARLGQASQGARDIDDLNAPPPEHGFFRAAVDRLEAALPTTDDPEQRAELLDGLATVCRMLSRQFDAKAEECYRQLVALDPDRSSYHYNLGLFLKTRGRFAEGAEANTRAMRLVAEPVESYLWNHGICATGAGDGAAALATWKSINQVIEMGRFELPDGGYPPCKVRLAERPLAERDAGSDDPGLEETIWIERLSPCHGIIRSVLFRNLGIDYGDVVLMDGAPMTYHTYGDKEVPVFPHLATLRRGNYRFFDFAGTQAGAGQLEEASDNLPVDAVVYSHTENFQTLCASCWRDPDIDHEQHEPTEANVVTGRIAVPPDVDAPAVLSSLDSALAGNADCKLFAPDLCTAAGQTDRAEVERRRYDMLTVNTG